MRAREELPLVLAAMVSVALRLDQLLRQIPASDEWHALRIVARENAGWTFTHFGAADHCIPQTLYFELLANTIGLGEIGFRLPSLVAGVATVVLVPLLVRSLVGKHASDAFALLLAVSPMLVFFSRWSRPYAIALLLTITGLLAAWRWREEAKPAWAWAYVGCAILGSWFLPPYMPILFLGITFLFADSLVRPGSRLSPSRILLVGACMVVGTLVLLMPPITVDMQSMERKMGRDTIDLATARQTLELYTGDYKGPFQVGVLVASILGLGCLARRAPAFASYLVLAIIFQAGALWLVGPHTIDSGPTFGRYMLPALPVMLLLVAVPLGALDRVVSQRWGLGKMPWFGASGAALFLLLGPLGDIHVRPSNWTNHADHQDTYDPEMRRLRYEISGRRRKRLPTFYEDLGAREPGSLLILETPWYYAWQHVPFHVYQRTHRQYMCVGFLGRGVNENNELPLGDGRFSFRSFVDVDDHEAVVARGVDYAIFHKNLKRELRRNAGLPEVDVADHVDDYRRRFGPSVFEDKDIVVFKVSG